MYRSKSLQWPMSGLHDVVLLLLCPHFPLFSLAHLLESHQFFSVPWIHWASDISEPLLLLHPSPHPPLSPRIHMAHSLTCFKCFAHPSRKTFSGLFKIENSPSPIPDLSSIVLSSATDTPCVSVVRFVSFSPSEYKSTRTETFLVHCCTPQLPQCQARERHSAVVLTDCMSEYEWLDLRFYDPVIGGSSFT